MTSVKVRFPAARPVARIYFDQDCFYPGWYVRYRLHGTQRKLALSTWDPADAEGARTEAASLLHVPADRVEIASST